MLNHYCSGRNQLKASLKILRISEEALKKQLSEVITLISLKFYNHVIASNAVVSECVVNILFNLSTSAIFILSKKGLKEERQRKKKRQLSQQAMAAADCSEKDDTLNNNTGKPFVISGSKNLPVFVTTEFPNNPPPPHSPCHSMSSAQQNHT